MCANSTTGGLQGMAPNDKHEVPEVMKIEDVGLDQPTYSEAEVNKIKRKVDSRVLVALSVMYIANQLDRGNVSFAYVSGMEQELDYKGNRYTLAISIYFPFYILATPVATVLVRKLGPRIFLPAVRPEGKELPAGYEPLAQFGSLIKYPGSRTLLMVNHEYTVEEARELIQEGKIDLVTFARPFIYNPDLITRIKHDIHFATNTRGGKVNYGPFQDPNENYNDWPTSQAASETVEATA
ncbi:hypothetical protein BJX62DRAFT_236702 [Aspergillus germanicus]